MMMKMNLLAAGIVLEIIIEATIKKMRPAIIKESTMKITTLIE